jgi:pantoate ligase / CMP/dCMP kinase
MDDRTRSGRRGHELVVALDGPGSSGKSSVGTAAAHALGYRFCDTGLLYRAVTWLALSRGVAETDAAGLVALVGEVELGLDERGRYARVLVDGQDVTEVVRDGTVDARVSVVARVPELRAALLERQRTIAAAGRIVMAGRDIGTVVLPHADLKIFLDASVEERARRRAQERGLDPHGPEAAEVLDALRRRDELDRTRPVAPLRPARDAVTIVTDGNRLEDSVAAVVKAIRAAEDVREAARRRRIRTKLGDMEPLDSDISLLIRTAAFVSRLVAGSVTRVRFGGAVDEIPREGPVIVIANHISNADPVIVGAWLTPHMGRRLHWLGKKELFDWPIIGWLARHGGVYPVDRATADAEALRLARRILSEGLPLIVFPEGTRSPNGELQRAKDGVALLALRTGAPIVPIGIADADRVWPKGRFLPRPGGRITVTIGRPFILREELERVASDGGGGRVPKEVATALMMRKVAELLPPRHRGVYADAVDAPPGAGAEVSAPADA